MNQVSGDITELLRQITAGDESAKAALLENVYGELRKLAGGMMVRERPEHTLQCTALVHEATVRLLDKDSFGSAANRAHFFQTMAQAMRRVLVEHARRRNRLKRGGDWRRVPLDVTVELIEQEQGIDLLVLDEALEKLREVGPRECQAIELRFFAGLEIHDIAEQLEISDATVNRDLKFARIWLHRQLRDEQAEA